MRPIREVRARIIMAQGPFAGYRRLPNLLEIQPNNNYLDYFIFTKMMPGTFCSFSSMLNAAKSF
jgi:hypothetical protein